MRDRSGGISSIAYNDIFESSNLSGPTFKKRRFTMSDDMKQELSKASDSIGKLVGSILGITLMTMWITIVATFTYQWYTG